MMNKNTKTHDSTLLIPIFLYLIFTGAALSLILFGAKVYQSSLNKSTYQYNSNTVLAYMEGRVHANDETDVLQIDQFNGTDCLTIRIEVEGTKYCTKIYCYDGYLRELFMNEDFDMSLDSGTKLVPLEKIHIKQINDHLIEIECIDDKDNIARSYVNVRSRLYEN